MWKSTLKILPIHTPFKLPHPFAILAYFLNHLLVELLNGWLLIKETELKIGLIPTTKSNQLWHFNEEHQQFTKKKRKSFTFFSMHNVKCKNTKSMIISNTDIMHMENNSKFALIWQILLNKWHFSWSWRYFNLSLGNGGNFVSIRSDTFYSISNSKSKCTLFKVSRM